jgi:hypothetical protein
MLLVKTFTRTAIAGAALLLITQISGCATDFGKMVSESVRASLADQGFTMGPKAIDAAGLRNILPQFDPNKSTSEQFPHVAVTVLKSPPMWADLAQDVHTRKYFHGCFTLQAVVWSDATQSKTVGPFDWCSPRDLEVEPGTGLFVTIGFNGMPTAEDLSSHYLTGITRTEGPRPPNTLAPHDRATQQQQMNNNRARAASDLSTDVSSRFGLMFMNLRYAMGQTLQDQDFRVWIVQIKE